MMHLTKYRTIRFVKSDQGMYYYDMAALLYNPSTMGAVICVTIHIGRREQAIMVITVERHKELFTQRSV